MDNLGIEKKMDSDFYMSTGKILDALGLVVVLVKD
jgi:hypothetical protein